MWILNGNLLPQRSIQLINKFYFPQNLKRTFECPVDKLASIFLFHNYSILHGLFLFNHQYKRQNLDEFVFVVFHELLFLQEVNNSVVSILDERSDKFVEPCDVDRKHFSFLTCAHSKHGWAIFIHMRFNSHYGSTFRIEEIFLEVLILFNVPYILVNAALPVKSHVDLIFVNELSFSYQLFLLK